MRMDVNVWNEMAVAAGIASIVMENANLMKLDEFMPLLWTNAEKQAKRETNQSRSVALTAGLSVASSSL